MTTRHPSRAPMSSDGRPLVGWQEPEQEPEQERLARRYRAGRCVACGAAERAPWQAVCPACWAAGQRYCSGCARLVALADYRANNSRCRRCIAAYDARRRQSGGKAAQRAAQARGRAAQRARAALRAIGWHQQLQAGAGWDAIGARESMRPDSVSSTYYRVRAQARRLRGPERADLLHAVQAQGVAWEALADWLGDVRPDALRRFYHRYYTPEGDRRAAA